MNPLDEMARLSENQPPRYVIVEAPGKKRLAELVNAYMREGFFPQGGAIVLAQDIWAQAMVKPAEIVATSHKLTADQRMELAAVLLKYQEGKPVERRAE